MAALRERHPARDGLGYADRPRLHNAFSLDAQSGSICLSLAGRRRHSHSHSNINTYRDCNFYNDTKTYAHAEGRADAEAASYAAAAAIAGKQQQLENEMQRRRAAAGEHRKSAYSVWSVYYKLSVAQQTRRSNVAARVFTAKREKLIDLLLPSSIG